MVKFKSQMRSQLNDKKIWKVFQVLPLLMSIKELYQTLPQANGDILDLVVYVGFIYQLKRSFFGKFKDE